MATDERYARRYVTDRGDPIPYVADWSSESRELLMWDAALGRYAIFTAGARGLGTPVLGRMNPPRQRECMIRHRCQVCFRPLAAPHFAVIWPGQMIVHKGRSVPLLMEPFACADCLRVAFTACPGLARRRAESRVATVYRYELVMTLCKPQGELAKLKNLPAEGVVSYVKAALIEYEEFGVKEWLAAVAAGVTACGGSDDAKDRGADKRGA